MNSSAPAGRPWPWRSQGTAAWWCGPPRRLSQARIDDFVASHAGWIARHLEQQRRRAALAPSAPTQAEIGALKEKARQVLPPKIAYYSEKMGLFPTGVRITSRPHPLRQLQRKEQPVLLLFSHELSGCGHGPGGGP